MIRNVIVGDIAGEKNESDIIIGMNTTFSEIYGISKPFIDKVTLTHPVTLGSVVSFNFTPKRNLHLLVCHNAGEKGWARAPEYVRFGLDYLHHTEGEDRTFSIVRIGAGRIGSRDGANHAEILTAMANSHLPVDLYVRDPATQEQETDGVNVRYLHAYRHWNPQFGEQLVA